MSDQPPGPWSPVIISPREIYDAVIRLDGSVRGLLQQMTQHTDEHVRRDEDVDARFQDLEQRMRRREQAAWPLPSLSLLIAVAGVVIAFISLAK